MSKVNKLTPMEIQNERTTVEARADLLHRAKLQGVTPFTSKEDLLGDPEFTSDFDVDDFIRAVREWRDTPSSRSLE